MKKYFYDAILKGWLAPIHPRYRNRHKAADAEEGSKQDIAKARIDRRNDERLGQTEVEIAFLVQRNSS